MEVFTMNNFTFQVPTKIHFGKGQIKQLREEVAKYGKRVLLVYGGGSIKKMGLYDEVYAQLEGFSIEEVSGVNPNPRIESVYQGATICKEKNIDVVLSVGGGSTLDCSKVIAAGACFDGDAWDLVSGKVAIEKALPVIDIITLSATGSEMNNTAVISNMQENLKLGLKSDHLYPKVSILDPTYTFSVPANQTAAGTADIMSHVMEAYFNDTKGAFFQQELAHSLLRLCIQYGPLAIQEPDNYEARANLMWGSTIALNGLIASGFGGGWSCHSMEHVLSAYHDVTHGVGLAILTPRWMRHILDDSTVDRFVLFGTQVWGIDASLEAFEIANKAIDALEKFFKEQLQIPMTLEEVGVPRSSYGAMAETAVSIKGGKLSGWRSLYKEDIIAIYEAC